MKLKLHSKISFVCGAASLFLVPALSFGSTATQCVTAYGAVAPEETTTYGGIRTTVAKVDAAQNYAAGEADRILTTLAHPNALEAFEQASINQGKTSQEVADFLTSNSSLLARREITSIPGVHLSEAARGASSGSAGSAGALMTRQEITSVYSEAIKALNEMESIGGWKFKAGNAVSRVPLLGRMVGSGDKSLAVRDKIQMLDESLVKGIASLRADNRSIDDMRAGIASRQVNLGDDITSLVALETELKGKLLELDPDDHRYSLLKEHVLPLLSRKITNMQGLYSSLTMASESSKTLRAANTMQMVDLTELRETAIPSIAVSSAVQQGALNLSQQVSKSGMIRDIASRSMDRATDALVAARAAQSKQIGEAVISPEVLQRNMKKLLALAGPEAQQQRDAIAAKQASQRAAMLSALETSLKLTDQTTAQAAVEGILTPHSLVPAIGN